MVAKIKVVVVVMDVVRTSNTQLPSAKLYYILVQMAQGEWGLHVGKRGHIRHALTRFE